MKKIETPKLQNKCSNCEIRNDQYFCAFEEGTLREFESLKVTIAYPKGSALFYEGEPTNGVYMLCQGKVKLSITSQEGKAIILHVAEGGEVLGLSAAVSNNVHESTAQVIEHSQVNFVRKDDLLRFLRKNGEAGLHAITQLSYNYNKAYTQIRSLGLSNSARDKLARLFLEWSHSNGSSNGKPSPIKVAFTHEEIAEMIGASRETVTRLLKDFKASGLIAMQDPHTYIFDMKKLHAVVGSRENGY